MKSTDGPLLVQPLSDRQVMAQVRNVKVMLRGFYRLASLRLKQFKTDNKISKERYFELLRFFDNIKDRIVNEKLETTEDIKVQNGHLGDYAYVAASFIPDAEMWVSLLNERPLRPA